MPDSDDDDVLARLNADMPPDPELLATFKVDPDRGTHIFDIADHLVGHVMEDLTRAVEAGYPAAGRYMLSNGMSLDVQAKSCNVYFHLQYPIEVLQQRLREAQENDD